MSDKKILITGAASGIGLATAKAYLQREDVQVIAVDKNAEGLQQFASSLAESEQSRLHYVSLDLCDHQAVPAQLQELVSDGIDHIVISHALGIENSITDNDKWDLLLNVNLMATQRLLSFLDPHINSGGRVVVLSSVLGRAGKKTNTGYVTSKHALLGLVKALALDWAERRITVNAVLPCWVDTPMLRTELEPQAKLLGLSVERLLRQIKKRIPLRQLIKSSDVADTVLFLTSPQAAMITAQSIVIDGGYGCGV